MLLTVAFVKKNYEVKLKKTPGLLFLMCEIKFAIFIAQIEMKVPYSENNLHTPIKYMNMYYQFKKKNYTKAYRWYFLLFIIKRG